MFALVGLDEVGRGSACGALFACAVALPDDYRKQAGPLLPRLRDSKTLSARQRQAVAAWITRNALRWEIEAVPVEDINRNGIQWANRSAFERLICRIPAQRYIVDGTLRLELPEAYQGRVQTRVRAEDACHAVAAASILAKVARDEEVARAASTWPGYGWERNAGYLTAEHIAALRTLGPCPYHRVQYVNTALAKAAPAT